MFRKHDLSPYLAALSKEYDRSCPWCGEPLQIRSLKEIGIKNTSHNGLIRCSNPECDFVDYIFPDSKDEKYFARTGKVPIHGRIISFEQAKALCDNGKHEDADAKE